MTCERCLVDQKLFIEKNYFKVFKDFDTEEHETCSQSDAIKHTDSPNHSLSNGAWYSSCKYIENIVYTNKIYIYIYIYLNIIFNN